MKHQWLAVMLQIEMVDTEEGSQYSLENEQINQFIPECSADIDIGPIPSVPPTTSSPTTSSPTCNNRCNEGICTDNAVCVETENCGIECICHENFCGPRDRGCNEKCPTSAPTTNQPTTNQQTTNQPTTANRMFYMFDILYFMLFFIMTATEAEIIEPLSSNCCLSAQGAVNRGRCYRNNNRRDCESEQKFNERICEWTDIQDECLPDPLPCDVQGVSCSNPTNSGIEDLNCCSQVCSRKDRCR